MSYTKLIEGIAGTAITPEEAITACGVRNRDTGEVIECEWHADGWQEAWDRGWYRDVARSLDAHSAREMTDCKGGYEAMEEITEDGFITTKGRFLDRKTALVLARKANQVNRNMRPDDDMIQHSSTSKEKTHDPYLRAEEINFVDVFSRP